MKSKLHSLAFFGLIMVSLMILTGLIAAVMEKPAGLLVMAAVTVLLYKAVRSRWFLVAGQVGALATGYDSIANLRTGKYTNAAAAVAGEIFVANGCVLVSTGVYALATEGVYIYMGKMTLPKEAPLVISFLDQVYWDDAAKQITKTSAGNTPCGFCVEGVLSADTTVTILLVPNLEYITASEIGPNAVTPIKMGTRAVVALADAAAAPTIAQLMTSSIFTMTPTAARTFTTPTAAAMVAGVTGATVGSWFDFTIVNLGNFPITLTAGDAGVTLSGNAVVNKGSATFRARLDNVTGAAEALTIYRKDGAIVAENIPVASGKILIGDANGLAAAQTPSGVVSMTAAGVFSLTSAGSPLANTIADPGSGAAIPVAAQGVCALTVGAGAETNTLANPPARGMLLAITCDTAGGGTRTITAAAAINQAANTTIALTQAADTIMLYSTFTGGALRWRVLANDGCVLG